MVFDAVESFLKQARDQVPPVILFAPAAKPPFGKGDWEPRLVEEALRFLRETRSDPVQPDLTHTVFYADETSPSTIAEAARTLPFLASRQVILVRHAEYLFSLRDDAQSPLVPLLEYLCQPDPATTLVLVSAKVDRRRKLFREIERCGAVVESPQLTDAAMTRRVQDEAARAGKRIDAETIRELLERVGNRLDDVLNALNLAVNFVGTAEVITSRDVLAACADLAEETVWGLTDAIAAGDIGGAVRSLRQLQDLNKAPEEILGTIQWLLESAYRAHPQTRPALEKQFVRKKVEPMAMAFGPDLLRRAMARCTRAQFELRQSGSDPELMLELLVIQLAWTASARARAGAKSRRATARG
ncbi:MAG TPA: DNA polymerase III subunit delta [Candidatus Hydrogenedentes bacterium]|nr:DNA polymerase III subunit delta [Candidatus Hydrogenedentota bacterium]